MAGLAASGTAGSGPLWSSSAVTAGDYFRLGSGPTAKAAAAASGLGSQDDGIAWILGTSFTLKANSFVVISATAQASVTASPGESAYANANLQFSDAHGNCSIGQAYQYVYANGEHWQNLGPLTAQASFANRTTQDVSGLAGVYAEASTNGVAQVPEPTAYSLMIAGLLALGFVVLRRGAN